MLQGSKEEKSVSQFVRKQSNSNQQTLSNRLENNRQKNLKALIEKQIQNKNEEEKKPLSVSNSLKQEKFQTKMDDKSTSPFDKNPKGLTRRYITNLDVTNQISNDISTIKSSEKDEGASPFD